MKYEPRHGDKYTYALGNQPRVLSVVWHEATYDWFGWCGRSGELMHDAGWALEGDRLNNNFFVWWDVAEDMIEPV